MIKRRRRRQRNPYAPIIETETTVFLGFEYNTISGDQVLFQDAACTIPVEEVGDPVGGYRDFETGEILAVQTTDANRPIWGGEGVGLVFDGSQWLWVPDKSKTNFLHEQDSSAFVDAFFEEDNGEFQTLMGSNRSSVLSRGACFGIDDREDYKGLFVIIGPGTGLADAFYLTDPRIDVGPPGRFIGSYSAGGTDNLRFFREGNFTSQAPNRNEVVATGDSEFFLTIGSARHDELLSPYTGNIRSVVLYDRQLTDAQHADYANRIAG